MDRHIITADQLQGFLDTHTVEIASASGSTSPKFSYSDNTKDSSMRKVIVWFPQADVFEVWHGSTLIESTESLEKAVAEYNNL